MSHVTRMDESCHMYESVMSHIWMREVKTYVNESCHTYEWVMSHIWMSHITNMNESRHTNERVLPHTWMCTSHRIRTPRGAVTHSYVWHDQFMFATWLIHMCGLTHSYVWHDSFIRVTWLIQICDMTHPRCATPRSQDLTRKHVFGSFICVIGHIHMCDLTYS